MVVNDYICSSVCCVCLGQVEGEALTSFSLLVSPHLHVFSFVACPLSGAFKWSTQLLRDTHLQINWDGLI